MIEVSPADFKRTHAGLVKLLRMISKTGSKGIATRRLCHKAFNSRNHCIELLKSARDQGLITREKEDPPGRGNKLVVNRITPAGKEILLNLEDI